MILIREMVYLVRSTLDRYASVQPHHAHLVTLQNSWEPLTSFASLTTNQRTCISPRAALDRRASRFWIVNPDLFLISSFFFFINTFPNRWLGTSLRENSPPMRKLNHHTCANWVGEAMGKKEKETPED